jgi:hypothetical protein
MRAPKTKVTKIVLKQGSKKKSGGISRRKSSRSVSKSHVQKSSSSGINKENVPIQGAKSPMKSSSIYGQSRIVDETLDLSSITGGLQFENSKKKSRVLLNRL